MAIKQTVELNVTGNIGEIKKSIQSIQQGFNSLNLDAAVGKKFETIITRLNNSIGDFEVKAAKGISSAADFSALQKSADKIRSGYASLRVELNSLAKSSPEAFKRIFPDDVGKVFAEAERAIKTYTTALEKSKNSIAKQTAEVKKQKDAYEEALAAQQKLSSLEVNDAKHDKLKKEKAKAIREQSAAQERLNEALEEQQRIEDKIAAKKAAGGKQVTKGGELNRSFKENRELLDSLEAQRRVVQETRVEIEQYDQQINSLTASLLNVTTLKQFTKDIEASNAQLATAKAKLDEATQALERLEQSDGTAAFEELKSAVEKLTGQDLSSLEHTEDSLEQIKIILQNFEDEKVAEVVQQISILKNTADGAEEPVREMWNTIEDSGGAVKELTEAEREIDNLKNNLLSFFSISNSIEIFKKAIRSAYESVKELDAAMTETAVVTDFSVGDMWEQLPQYTKTANELGVTTLGAYETMTLFYQQGLETNEVFEIGTETMKMARIAGLEYTDATNLMTAALRGFNMELSETSAMRVNDVYSELAKITAADTEEIATAMTKTASIANSANMEFETTAALLSQIIETTREAPETAGTALKTIIARFQELKKAPSEIQPIDGEMVDANKIEAALKTIGVSLRDTKGQFRDLDDVFLDISKKWDSLDVNTQRYIATMAAGSRQQSRFIAMMQDYDRTMELVSAANSSAGSSQEQYEKTLDSLETKLNQLKNAWTEFTMGLANSSMIKIGVDILTTLLNISNSLTNNLGSLGGAFTKLALAIVGLKAGKNIFKSLAAGLSTFKDVAGKTGSATAMDFFGGFKKEFQKNKKSLSKEAKTFSKDLKEAITSAKSKGENTLGVLLGQNGGENIFAGAAAQEYIKNSKTFATNLRNTVSQSLKEQLGPLNAEAQQAANDILDSFTQELYNTGDVQAAVQHLKASIEGMLESQNIQIDAEIDLEGIELNPDSITGVDKWNNALSKTQTIATAAGMGLSMLGSSLESLGFEDATRGVNSFAKGVTAAGMAATAASTVISLAGKTASAAWGVVGIVIAATIGVVTVVLDLLNAAQKRAEEAAEKARENAEALKNEASSMQDLYDTYESVYEQYQNQEATLNDLEEARKDLIDSINFEDEAIRGLVESYGIEADSVSILNLEYEDQYELLKKITALKQGQAGGAAYNSAIADAKITESKYGKGMIGVNFDPGAEYSEEGYSTVDIAGNHWRESALVEGSVDLEAVQKVSKLFEKQFEEIDSSNLVETYSLYQEIYDFLIRSDLGESGIALDLKDILESYGPAMDKAEEGLQGLMSSVISFQNMEGDIDLDQIYSVDQLYQYLKEAAPRFEELWPKFKPENFEGTDEEWMALLPNQDLLVEQLEDALVKTDTRMAQIVQDSRSQEKLRQALMTRRQEMLNMMAEGTDGRKKERILEDRFDATGMLETMEALLNSGASTELASTMLTMTVDGNYVLNEQYTQLSAQQIRDAAQAELDKAAAQTNLTAAYSITPVLSALQSEEGLEGLDESSLQEFQFYLSQIESTSYTAANALEEFNQIVATSGEGSFEAMKFLEDTQFGLIEAAQQQLATSQQNTLQLIKDQEAALEAKKEAYKAMVKDETGQYSSDVITEAREEIQSLQVLLKDLKDDYGAITLQLDIETNGIEQIQTITDAVISETERLGEAASMIGEGYRVAAEDVGSLMEIFPALAEEATILADGTLQLNATVVDEVLGGAEDIVKTDYDKTKMLLENQIVAKTAEIEANQARADAFAAYASGTVELDQMSVDDRQVLEEGFTAFMGYELGEQGQARADLATANATVAQEEGSYEADVYETTADNAASSAQSTGNSYIQGFAVAAESAYAFGLTAWEANRAAADSNAPRPTLHSSGKTGVKIASGYSSRKPEAAEIGSEAQGILDSLKNYGEGNNPFAENSKVDSDTSKKYADALADYFNSKADAGRKELGALTTALSKLQSSLNTTSNRLKGVRNGTGGDLDDSGSGGSGSGGSGGSAGESWLNDADFDGLYNLMADIEETARKINKLEEERERLLKDENSTAEEIQNNIDELRDLTEKQKEQYSQLAAYRFLELNSLLDDNKQYQKYATYNFDDDTVEIDVNAIGDIAEEEVLEAVENYISDLEEASKNYKDAVDSLEEIINKTYDKDVTTGDMILYRIKVLQEERNRLQQEYNDLLEDEEANAAALMENRKAQKEMLLEEKDLLERQLEYYESFGKKQVEALDNELGTYFKVFSDGHIEIDMDRYNALSADNPLIDSIDEVWSILSQNQDTIRGIRGEVVDVERAVKDIDKVDYSAMASLERQVYDALIEGQEASIEAQKEQVEAMDEAADKMLDGIRKAIDKARQDRENAEKEKDIVSMERKLAYLQLDTSNANALAIMQTEQELEEARQSYSDSLVDQHLQMLEEQNEEAKEQRQEMLDRLDEQLENLRNSRAIWAQVQEVINSSIGEDGKLIDGSALQTIIMNTEAFRTASPSEQQQMLNDLNKDAEVYADNYSKANQFEDRGITSQQITLQISDQGAISGWVDENGNVKITKDGQEYLFTQGFVDSNGTYRTYETFENAKVTPEDNGSHLSDYTKEEKEEPSVSIQTQEASKTEQTTPTLGVGSKINAGSAKIYTSSTGEGAQTQYYKNDPIYIIKGENNGYWKVAHYKNPNSIVGWFKKSDVKAYKTGGLVDSTGLAWLDGTKSKPEIVLNAQDSANFIALKDILAHVFSSRINNAENVHGGDNYYDIEINVEKIDNDYDVEQIADKIKTMITNDSMYRNVNAINMLR